MAAPHLSSVPADVVPLPRPGASQGPRTEPLEPVVRAEPMHSTVLAHIHNNTELDAVRMSPDGPVEIEIGSRWGGTHVRLTVRDDADVIRLIDALKAVYEADAS